MITVTCAATGRVERFEDPDTAIGRGWLRVTANPTDRSSEAARVFWFAPGQADQWAEVLIREGLATQDELASLADRHMPATLKYRIVREGRICD